MPERVLAINLTAYEVVLVLQAFALSEDLFDPAPAPREIEEREALERRFRKLHEAHQAAQSAARLAAEANRPDN